MDQSYSDLVSSVISKPALKNHIQQMQKSGSSLNLVDLRWEEVLKNNLTFQRFKNPLGEIFATSENEKRGELTSELQYVKCFNDKLKIIIVTKCMFSYPPNTDKNDIPMSIYIPENEVLEMISKELAKDIKHLELLKDYKFTANESCHKSICRDCKIGHNFFKLGNHKMNYKHPCIRNTFVFDGESVCARFGSMIQQVYSKMFLAIVEVNLAYRLILNRDEKKCIRFGGNLHKIVAFDENKLTYDEPVFMGNYEPACFEPLITVSSECSSENIRAETANGTGVICCDQKGQFYEVDEIEKSVLKSNKRKLSVSNSEDDIIEAVPANFKYVRIDQNDANVKVEESDLVM